MTITGAAVVFAVYWFIVFYLVLQIRTKTQAESGQEIVPGTPISAPATEDVGRSAKIATMITIGLWALTVGIIMSGWITMEDIDFFNRLDFHHLKTQ